MFQPATIEASPQQKNSTPPKQRLRIADLIEGVASVMVGVSTLGGWHWLFDLVSHFLPYYALALLVVLPWLLWKRRWLNAGVSFTALVYCGFQIGPYFVQRPVPVSGQSLTVVVCNVLSGNETPELVLEWLRSNSSDVAVILEVTPSWVPRLETLKDVYPHQSFRARDGNFGIAVLSQREWLTMEQSDFASARLPSLVVDFDVAGTPLKLIATHPPPPGGTGYSLRNRQLQAVEQLCREVPGSCIVAGDLNATPWCHGFHLLTRNGRLFDTGLGFGIQPTWPILHGCSVLPIDHVLVSKDISVVRREVGPDVGSDHRPVVVELRIAH